MSARFEVLKNGQRICICGINGDGVLSAIVNHVQNSVTGRSLGMHIGGLGNYTDSPQPQHVSWRTPDLVLGDEVTIRVLPPGEFEAPHERKLAELIGDDPDFGQMTSTSTSCDSDIEFISGPIQTAHVHIAAYEHNPTDAQRLLFRQLATKHTELWPKISQALVRCHPDIETEADLIARLKSHVGIELDDDSRTIRILYQLNDEPEMQGLSIGLRDWEVVEICRVQ